MREMHKVEALVTTVEETRWQRISCGDGTKGPREYDWVRIQFSCPDAPGWERWLLVRRSKSDIKDKSYYLVFAKSGTCLEEMVTVAGTRWTIETCFETAKGEVGLDSYEVRSWTGWYRHITLALLAHAFLTVTRAQGRREFFKKEQTPAKPNNSRQKFKRQLGLCCP